MKDLFIPNQILIIIKTMLIINPLLLVSFHLSIASNINYIIKNSNIFIFADLKINTSFLKISTFIIRQKTYQFSLLKKMLYFETLEFID